MILMVSKRGRHLEVCIPIPLAAKWGLREGQKIDPIKTRKGIILAPHVRSRRTLNGMLAKMKSPNPYGEIDIG
jgi:antitoxin component of MazEF toxin-antitoxin module